MVHNLYLIAATTSFCTPVKAHEQPVHLKGKEGGIKNFKGFIMKVPKACCSY